MSTQVWICCAFCTVQKEEVFTMPECGTSQQVKSPPLFIPRLRLEMLGIPPIAAH